MKSLAICIAVGILVVVGSAVAESIEKDEAIEILVEDIIKPSNASDRLGAYMLSEPLQQGDMVSSESGQEYVIDNSTWFVFVDDEPCAMFEHPVRYVFINATTGNYTVVDETWPPMINNVSMWDTENMSRGELIEIYSILSEPVPITCSQTLAPSGDYGDAPDDQDAYYGVNGSFPTLFYTANSKLGRPGAHALNIGQEMLGVTVSAESDANDPYDPDGVPNLVDADSDERMFVIIENATAKLAFDVTVTASAPDVTRYVNALIDFDQSGNWSGSANGTEWAVSNMGVDVTPGTTETIITPSFSWGINNVSPVWMRVSLTREQVNETLFGAEGWDGSGQFEYGEIEDSLVFLMDCPEPLIPLPPPKKPLKPGPEKICCCYAIQYHALVINGGDKWKHLHHPRGKTPITKNSADTMHGVLEAQGYKIAAYLNPSNGLNTKAGIENAIKDLKENVNCGDRVFIYIVAHGNKAGGLAMYDQNGFKKKTETVEPSELKQWLDTIQECDKKPCDTKEKNCYVTVVLESCHAGNFKLLARKGIIVIGSSDTTCSYGTCGGPSSVGAYTKGFDDDLRDERADKDGDGDVEPDEAHASAEEKVEKNNKKYNKNQKPWLGGEWCDCVCDCVCVPAFTPLSLLLTLLSLTGLGAIAIRKKYIGDNNVWKKRN